MNKKHSIKEFTGAGDSVLCEYEIEKPEEVARARGVFDSAIRDGFAAVRPTPEGAVAVMEFDPAAEETFLLRPIAGG